MKTKLIGPDSLEIDAVVPQCLDNQCVSGNVFAEMMRRNVDYSNKEIAQIRERESRTEFIRSLIYSSQVIVQRHSFRSSRFLFQNYLPEEEENRKAFAGLMRGRVIVPYLFDENTLDGEPGLEGNKQGNRAFEGLLQEIGDDVTCARLDVDDAANRRAINIMSTDFGAKILRVRSMTEDMRNTMASELFGDPTRLQEDGAWQAFNRHLVELAKYAGDKCDELSAVNKHLTRSDVYLDRFVIDGSNFQNIVLGRFKRMDRQNPFLLELKKFVDLVYNTNLPDHLKRYAFTPQNMPSRMALQDNQKHSGRHQEILQVLSNKDALEQIRRHFMASMQKAMSLPLLSNLSVTDVVEIRALPEWEDFREAQSDILKRPLSCLEKMPQFHEKFDGFQRALSEWYNLKHERPRTERKYCSFVSLAVNLAGKLLIAGSDMGNYEKALAEFAFDRLAGNIPDRIQGYAAKLLVGVYDIGQEKLDRERTYAIDLLQTSEDLVKKDLAEFLNSLTHANSRTPGAAAQIADQGTK